MRRNKYGRELELIALLTDNTNYTAQQLADHLGITRRNLYYYFGYLRECGFTLVKTGTTYRLDRNAPFFRRLRENITLNTREAEYLMRLIDSAEKNDLTAQTIKMKLARSHGIGDITDPQTSKRINRNVANLKNAIATKSMARLCGYSSPHSASVSDRIVEPFLLMNNGQDVRCHELKSHQNKTFKVARMSEVEVLDVPWIHETKHKQVYTDVFMFSGEERHRVTIALGQLSRNLLVEEYPEAERYITEEGGRSVFRADVVSFRGVGRFVLGLYDDIEILGDDDFRTYIAAKITSWRDSLD